MRQWIGMLKVYRNKTSQFKIQEILLILLCWQRETLNVKNNIILKDKKIAYLESLCSAQV
jgi:hypothetical protein